MIVETGPNASTSWTASLRPRIVGAQQDRLHERAAAGADRGFGIAGDDARADCDSLAIWPRTSSRWLQLTSAPMRLPSSRGSPTVVLASRSRIAASTASRCSAGAMARRMAVHFCPALTVISLTTSLTNRSNSGVPGAASGPSSEALRLSCSAMKRTLSRSTPGGSGASCAVAAEPVKLTTSCPVRWSNRSPTPPTISCSAPGGSSPVSIMIRNAASPR